MSAQAPPTWQGLFPDMPKSLESTLADPEGTRISLVNARTRIGGWLSEIEDRLAFVDTVQTMGEVWQRRVDGDEKPPGRPGGGAQVPPPRAGEEAGDAGAGAPPRRESGKPSGRAKRRKPTLKSRARKWLDSHAGSAWSVRQVGEGAGINNFRSLRILLQELVAEGHAEKLVTGKHSVA
ncbi:hypothetical protein ACFWGI_39130, partial [Streptomyces niveus]